MAKIKQGQVHTATEKTIPVHIDNATERGGFQVLLDGIPLEPSQALALADHLVAAAGKAEILDAAVAA